MVPTMSGRVKSRIEDTPSRKRIKMVTKVVSEVRMEREKVSVILLFAISLLSMRGKSF